MAEIALLSIAGKPIHAGHWGLINVASRECDVVKLFVSTSDRRRPKQIPISGQAMLLVWRRYLECHLPDNVEVTYEQNPTSAVWDVLVTAEASNTCDTFVLYGDDVDVDRNYPTESLTKYAPGLLSNGQIVLRPVARSETIEVSGTQMRHWLQNGDRETFIGHLPDPVREDGHAIWDLLSRHV